MLANPHEFFRLARLEGSTSECDAPIVGCPANGAQGSPRPITSLIKAGVRTPFANVLKVVLDQGIVPDALVPNAIGLDRLAFSPTKLSNIAAIACRSAGYINQGEAMRALGCGHDTVTRLTAAGLIKPVVPEVGVKAHTNSILYRRAEFERFAASVLTAAALARELELEAWSLLRRLRASGIAPILNGRDPTNCFWDRGELSSLF